MSAASSSITFTINGAAKRLREQLDLIGTKRGCDHGQCGSAPCWSTTTEITGERLASIGHDAFQCGYCTPAQIFPGVGLMNEAKAKMADDIRELMEPCGALAWLSKRRA
ncbi:MAG: 2Fe-2S iron-sulfur cluster-binding protein [Acidobacteriota bacterium]|nr:2Fe-2S iron-sulfur cluster-binding protein [Acidobacteriota bacterium]